MCAQFAKEAAKPAIGDHGPTAATGGGWPGNGPENGPGNGPQSGLEGGLESGPLLPASPRRQRPAEKPGFIGFVRDAESAAILREVLAAAFPRGLDLRIADFQTTLATLHAIQTPRIVLIDLSGEEQPLSALMDLSEVVEPGTVTLAIGDKRDVSFYRSVTRSMGIREYLPKPFGAAAIRTNFLPWIETDEASVEPHRTGRLIAVTGTRGGTGASVVAANLAWLIGTERHRHTILLDSDLHTGTAALHLGTAASTGLRTALEAPARIDPLLIERAAQPAAERLHVLAAEEGLLDRADYADHAGISLVEALRRRYNFIIADVAAKPLPFARDLLHIAQLRVFVTDPTPVGLRNLDRLLDLPPGPLQVHEPIVVLNQAGRGGCLPADAFEQRLGRPVDVVIPDLPRLVARAAHFGEPIASKRGAFRDSIQKLADLVGAALGPDTANAAEAGMRARRPVAA